MGPAGPPGAAGMDAGPDGDSGGICIIITVCTSRDSDEVNIARKFRDRYLDTETLGGYYAIAHIVVPILKRFAFLRKVIKRFLVDRLIDFAKANMHHNLEWCYEYRSSKYVTKYFLGLCSLVGMFVNCQKLIAQHR